MTELSGHRTGHYQYNTQPSQDTNIQALIGIRTRDSKNRGARDLRVKPHGHCNRLIIVGSGD